MTPAEASIGIFTTDKDLRVRSWDDWLAKATGITGQHAVNQLLTELVPDLSHRGLLKRFEAVLTQGTTEMLAPSFHHHLIPCRPPVPSRHFAVMQQRVTIAPLRDDHRILGAMVTIEDVTARMERERDLAESLASPHENVRLQAAQSLAREESLDPVSPLVNALGDESWRVRKVVVDGLARAGSPEAVTSLLRALREEHTDLAVLNSALQTLALMDLDTVSPLLEFLRDPDPELRLYAALALGEMNDLRAAPALIDALDDPEVNVSYHAIEALGKLRAEKAVDSLCAIVESRDFFLSFAALDALIRINNPGVVSRLLPALADPLLQELAIDGLGKLGSQQAAAPLAALLDDPTASPILICRALASLHDRFQEQFDEGGSIAENAAPHVSTSGIANLMRVLDHAEPKDLRPLALVLGWLRGCGVEQTLVRLLGEPSARREVVEALVRHGDGVLDLLIEKLLDEDLEVRKATVIALGRIGEVKAVPALLKTLNEDPELQVITCGALAKIGDRRAFQDLLDLLAHPQAAVRQAAIAALHSLGHPQMAERMKTLLQSPKATERESAAKIAGYFGYPECAELLYACCRDPVEAVRCAALENIVYLDDEQQAIIHLTKALQEGTDKVRAAAARALALAPSKEALPLLLQGLRDDDPWVRYFAARALARHHFTDESPSWHAAFNTLIRRAREDLAQPVRIAAIQALGAMGDYRAIAALIPLTEDPEADVAHNALAALGSIQHPDALSPLLRALQEARGQKRKEILKALGERGGAQVAAVLQWIAAEEGDDGVVATTITALRRMHCPESARALLALAADPARRDRCLTALSGMERRGIPWVAEGLQNDDHQVRSAAAEALARMKDVQATAHLVEALDDAEAAVRLTAIAGLSKLGASAGHARLMELARSDPDLTVRRAAQHALGAARHGG